MKIKPSQIKIGSELYQYSSKIIAYEVIGLNELKTKEHTEIFYILKCLSCQDHKPCEIAIKFNDYGDLEYSHMVNQYEDDEEYKEEHEHYKNSQFYWHKNKDYYWFLSKKEARLFIHYKNISYYNEEITKASETIKRYEKCIGEENEKINALTESEGSQIDK